MVTLLVHLCKVPLQTICASWQDQATDSFCGLVWPRWHLLQPRDAFSPKVDFQRVNVSGKGKVSIGFVSKGGFRVWTSHENVKFWRNYVWGNCSARQMPLAMIIWNQGWCECCWGLMVMLDFTMKRTTARLTIYTLQHITAVMCCGYFRLCVGRGFPPIALVPPTVWIPRLTRSVYRLQMG